MALIFLLLLEECQLSSISHLINMSIGYVITIHFFQFRSGCSIRPKLCQNYLPYSLKLDYQLNVSIYSLIFSVYPVALRSVDRICHFYTFFFQFKSDCSFRPKLCQTLLLSIKFFNLLINIIGVSSSSIIY